MSRVGQWAMDKKEQEFLELVNRENYVPPYSYFNSTAEVRETHDCTMGPEDGCLVCQLLVDWGYIPDYYPEYEAEDYNI